jgi:hypothetical protein
MMLTANLIELITRKTSGLSNVLIELLTAVSIAELSAEKELIRTYVRLEDLISMETKPAAD